MVKEYYYRGPSGIPVTPNDDKKENPGTTEAKRLNIEVDLDGEKLAKEIAENAEKRIVDEITNVARKLIFVNRYYNTHYSYDQANEYDLKDWITDAIKEAVNDSKDQIVERAAEKLADSMRRSKPVRERFCELLEEETK